MVSHLKTFNNKECKIAKQKKACFRANFVRIRRLYNKDQGVIQQGSGGYTTRIRIFFFFFSANFALLAGFFGATIRIGQEMLCFPYAKNFIPNISII